MHLLRLAPILMLAACASTPIPFAETKLVPADRRYYNDSPAPAATVTVVRDKSNMPGGRGREIWIDGKLAALLDPGERVSFAVRPGDHVLKARIQPTPITVNVGEQSIGMTAEAGKTYYYRMGSLGGGGTKFAPTISADE